MKSSQWIVFGVAFFILGMMLANISLQAGTFCNYDFNNSISCVRQQVFSVFPYIFFLLGSVCFINNWIESHSKKKEEKVDIAKSLQRLLDLSDEKFVRQMIRKYNLKEDIKDIEELEEISKKDRKNEKKIKDEIEKYFKNTEEMREGFLNNLKKGFN